MRFWLPCYRKTAQGITIFKTHYPLLTRYTALPVELTSSKGPRKKILPVALLQAIHSTPMGHDSLAEKFKSVS